MKCLIDKFPLYTALLFLFFIFFYHNNVHALDSGRVYSLNKGNPVPYLDTFKVSTITRGFAANQPFKAIVQIVPKSIFSTAFRRVLGVTPYGIAFAVAYEIFFNDDGELIKKVDSIGGSCNIGGATTLSGCLATAQAYYSQYPTWGTLIASFNGIYYVIHDGTGNVANHQFTPNGNNGEQEVLYTDSDLMADYDEYILSQQGLNHNDAFLDEYGNPNEEMFPNPIYYENSPEDLVLTDLYESGLLQSTDPLLDNYVTPAEYQRIADLHAELNKTPEQQAEELTADIDKPMTKAQHAENQAAAESRLKTDADTLNNIDLSGLDKTTELDQQFDILDTMMTNTTDLPSLLPNIPQLMYSATCKTVAYTYDGATWTFPSVKECAGLTKIKEMIGFLLYFVTFLLITFQLFKEAN